MCGSSKVEFNIHESHPLDMPDKASGLVGCESSPNKPGAYSAYNKARKSSFDSRSCCIYYFTWRDKARQWSFLIRLIDASVDDDRNSQQKLRSYRIVLSSLKNYVNRIRTNVDEVSRLRIHWKRIRILFNPRPEWNLENMSKIKIN